MVVLRIFFPVLFLTLVLTISACQSNGQTDYRDDLRTDLQALDQKNNIYLDPTSDLPFSGTVLETFANGKVKMRGKLVDGQFEEKHEWYFPNGTLHQSGSMQKGSRIGEWQYYYSNGQLFSEKNFIENGLLEGPYRSWYPDGTQWEKGAYTDNGRWEGDWTIWYHTLSGIDTLRIDSDSEIIRFLPMDAIEGIAYFWSNFKIFNDCNLSSLSSEGECSLGVDATSFLGRSRLELIGGEPTAVTTFVNSEMNGKTIVWLPVEDSHQSVSSGLMINGIREGKWSSWQIDSDQVMIHDQTAQIAPTLFGDTNNSHILTKISEINYAEGVLEGDSKSWDLEGNLTDYVVYSNGEIIENRLANSSAEIGGVTDPATVGGLSVVQNCQLIGLGYIGCELTILHDDWRNPTPYFAHSITCNLIDAADNSILESRSRFIRQSIPSKQSVIVKLLPFKAQHSNVYVDCVVYTKDDVGKAQLKEIFRRWLNE